MGGEERESVCDLDRHFSIFLFFHCMRDNARKRTENRFSMPDSPQCIGTHDSRWMSFLGSHFFCLPFSLDVSGRSEMGEKGRNPGFCPRSSVSLLSQYNTRLWRSVNLDLEFTLNQGREAG